MGKRTDGTIWVLTGIDMTGRRVGLAGRSNRLLIREAQARLTLFYKTHPRHFHSLQHDWYTDGDAAMLPYRFATTELLDRSETFLTMVRSGGAAEESVDEVREWARPLLTRTRLLLGSPAAGDPELRALLDDLEIVLVQIAQLPEDDSEERGWIDE